jgi:dihydroorotate dehydrogenase (NAD+) catalytic subunit
MTAADALEFIIAGATAVQVGTANFINPRATEEIIDGIESYLIEHRIDSVKALIGSMAND